MGESVFKGTPTIETERLLLRRLKSEDAVDIFAYASDDEVTRYMTWNTHQSIEDSHGFINYVLDRYVKDEAGEWGIILKQTGKLIGAIGFPYCDMSHRKAEIGYVLNREFWGKGYMPEALETVLAFAFQEMGLNRVECCHFRGNEKSGRVMQKAGMNYEGCAKQKIYMKNRFWDIEQYAILCSDWCLLNK